MSGTSTTAVDSPSYTALCTDRTLLALTFASYIGMFNVSVVSPAIPAISKAFSLPDAQIGLVMSAFTLPGIVFVLLVGNLADLYGKNAALLFSLLLFGIAGSAIAFVDSFVALLALRAVQGVGAAAIQPLIAALIGDIYRGVVGSTAHGIRASVNGLSMLLMPIVVGLTLTYSWRYVFLFNALAVVGAIVIYVFVPNQTPETRSDHGPLRAFVDQSAQTFAEIRKGQKAILVLGGLARGFAIFAVLTFVPLYADRSFAATSIGIGLIVAMRGLARVVVAPFSGVILSRCSHRTALIAAMGISAVSVLLIPVAPNLVLIGVLVGIYSIGDSIFYPVFMDALTVTASDQGRAGVVSAASFFRKVGTTASPIVFGIVLAFVGFTPIFVVTAVVLVGYSILVAIHVNV